MTPDTSLHFAVCLGPTEYHYHQKKYLIVSIMKNDVHFAGKGQFHEAGKGQFFEADSKETNGRG